MRVFAIVIAFLAAACGSSSTGPMGPGTGGNGAADMSGTGAADLAKGAASDLAGGSGTDGGNHALCCNDPGNTGNSVGVGKYCNDSSMCGGGAPFCATIGDPTEHFCTTPCSMGSTTCGDGASCQCQGGQCGCVPDACVTPPPGC